MTTVTGGYSINFSGKPNESPWTDNDWNYLHNTFELHTGGLRPNGFLMAAAILSGRQWGEQILSKIEITTNAAATGDPLGPALFVEGAVDLNGYVLAVNGTAVSLSKYVAGTRQGLISHTLSSVSNGDTFYLGAGISMGSVSLSVYHNGTQISALDYVDSDDPFVEDLAGGVWGSAENNNGRRIGSVAFDGVVITPGLRITAIHRPNNDDLVADATGVAAVAYDEIGGTKLWQGAVDIVDGNVEIDSGDLGDIDDNVFLVLRWFVANGTGSDEYTYAATETVINLDA